MTAALPATPANIDGCNISAAYKSVRHPMGSVGHATL
jgi:hypothetical protein